MNSLKVSWDAPDQPNGIISGYVVTYETAQQDEAFSKQVKQKVTTTWLVVANLEEEVTYYFSVRASTYDLGLPSRGNVTTGPQEGSPGRLKDLFISRTTSAVSLQWENGPSGKAPIIGYYIESRKKGTHSFSLSFIHPLKSFISQITDDIFHYFLANISFHSVVVTL